MSKSDKTACKHKHWLSPKSLVCIVCILKPNAEVLSRLSSLVFLTPPTESSLQRAFCSKSEHVDIFELNSFFFFYT